MREDLENKLLKHAADNSLFDSPLVQAGMFGSLGYLGADYLYDKFANNKWQEAYINSIADPEQREIVRAKYKMDRENKKKWIRRGAGLVGAITPLLLNYGTLSAGWDKGKQMWGGRTVVDKGLGGAAGLLSTAVGGNRALDNMHDIDKANTKKMQEFNKIGSEKSYIYENVLNKRSSEFDGLEGVDFKMPYVRPLYTNGIEDIPVAGSIKHIQSFPNSAIMGPQLTNKITEGFYDASGGLGAGLISTNDLAKSLTRVGLGAYAGKKVSEVLGTILAQPPTVKQKLSDIGAIGGAVINSGIFR